MSSSYYKKMETTNDIKTLAIQFQQLLKKIDEIKELVDNLEIEIPERRKAESEELSSKVTNYWKLYNFTERYKEITITLFLQELQKCTK